MSNGKARKGELQYAATSVTATKLKLLATTAHELVPAQGEGTFIEFVSIWLALRSGSEVLAETADNLAVCYTNESGPQLSVTIEMTGFIDLLTNPITCSYPIVAAPIIIRANANNKALVLANLNDNFTGNASNDAVLHCKTAYRVHNFW